MSTCTCSVCRANRNESPEEMRDALKRDIQRTEYERQRNAKNEALKNLVGIIDGTIHPHFLPQAMREAKEALDKAEGK